MFTINLEDPEQVLDYLGPMLHACHEAVDHGVSLADSKMGDLESDPFLWAHIVRYGANRWLDGLKAGGWERGRVLANSGIELRRMPLVVRVVKAQGGGPPHPGTSVAKQAFWMQENERLPITFGSANIPRVSNFLLDWTVGPAKEVVLSLSKPNGKWKFKQRPRLAWRKPVVLTTDGQRFSAAEERDLDIAAVIDDSELGLEGSPE